MPHNGPSLFKRLRHKTRDIFLREHWMVGIIDAPVSAALHWRECPPVRWLGARSAKGYLADPFAWPGDTSTLLCEEFDYASRRGRIVRVKLEDDAIAAQEALAMPFSGHLSYPFLFSHGGEVYCLPESGAARKLMLLRWDGKTFVEHCRVLEGIAASDSICFYQENRWWIAYTDGDIGRHDNLNLCHAASLLGPWQPHPGNPVKRGLRNSRCGGTPFFHEGSLYRPAQDCSESYGGALTIQRVSECTPERYREEEVTRIAPERGINRDGIHTLSAFGNRCLVDGKRLEFSPGNVLRKIRRRMR